jgi:hypothetical protein
MLLAGCVGARAPVFPHYVPIFFSPVDGQWHVTPICDGLPMMDRTGAITGCFGDWRPPVYECAAEDGSGRTVRVEYGGDPVRLSEGLADEPGGLWSCTTIAVPGAPTTCTQRAPAPSRDGGAVMTPTPAAPVTCSSILGVETSDEYCKRCPDVCAVSPLVTPGPSGNILLLNSTTQAPTSAADVLTDLSLAAASNHGATCAISAWAPLPDALEACE